MSEIVHFLVGNLDHYIHVRPDPYRGGYEARLGFAGGVMMMPNGATRDRAVENLIRELTDGNQTDRVIARVVTRILQEKGEL